MNITDHAIVRYVERFHGLNLDVLKREIEARLPKQDGLHRLEGTDMLCVVKNGHLLTMYAPSPPKPKKPRKSKPRPVPVDEKRAVIEEMWAGYNRFAEDAA